MLIPLPSNLVSATSASVDGSRSSSRASACEPAKVSMCPMTVPAIMSAMNKNGHELTRPPRPSSWRRHRSRPKQQAPGCVCLTVGAAWSCASPTTKQTQSCYGMVGYRRNTYQSALSNSNRQSWDNLPQRMTGPAFVIAPWPSLW